MNSSSDKAYWVRKIAFYIFGIVVMSFGIALSILADIGVAPGSVIPYAASKLTPLTVGWCTTIFQILCISTQIIMQKRITIGLVIQFPVAFLVGQLIDFWMWLMPVTPTGLISGIALLCAGILIFSLGIRAVAGSGLFLLPGDDLARAIGVKMGWALPKAKLVYDIASIVVAVILMLAFSKDVFSVVALGTVICAAVTGPIIGLYTKLFPFFDVVRPEKTEAPLDA